MNNPDDIIPIDSRPAPSDRKLAAARANGALAKGSKTPEGIARSAMNAVTTGFTAKTLVLSNESRPQFIELHDSYFLHLRPVGPVEEDLLDRAVVARWRERRALGIETATLDLQMDKDAPEFKSTFILADETTRQAVAFHGCSDKSLSLLRCHAYESRQIRIYERSLRELLRLQALRKSQSDPDDPGPAPAIAVAQPLPISDNAAESTVLQFPQPDSQNQENDPNPIREQSPPPDPDLDQPPVGSLVPFAPRNLLRGIPGEDEPHKWHFVWLPPHIQELWDALDEFPEAKNALCDKFEHYSTRDDETEKSA